MTGGPGSGPTFRARPASTIICSAARTTIQPTVRRPSGGPDAKPDPDPGRSHVYAVVARKPGP